MKSLTINDGIGTAAGAGVGFLVSLAVKKGTTGMRKHKMWIGIGVGAVAGFAFTKFALPMIKKPAATTTAQ